MHVFFHTVSLGVMKVVLIGILPTTIFLKYSPKCFNVCNTMPVSVFPNGLNCRKRDQDMYGTRLASFLQVVGNGKLNKFFLPLFMFLVHRKIKRNSLKKNK